MHPKNFVICDMELEYAKNLMRVIDKHGELGVQMHLFQDLEQLKEFSKQKDIHIMVIDEDYPAQERRQIGADRRYILVKGDERDLLPGEKAIYKYQSSDMILGSIQEGTMIISEEPLSKKANTAERQLIGIYSPIHRIGKTRLAMDLGRGFAKNGPVLYLNLEEYSGCSYYFPDNEEADLGDLLYYIRQESGNIGLRISAIAGQIDGMDYIPPMPVIQDLRSVREEEWINLFEKVFQNCIYKTVILDLGDGIDGLYEILRRCYTVYTPYIEDPVSQAKLKQYVRNLRQTGYEDVLEHTIQKKIEVRAGESI